MISRRGQNIAEYSILIALVIGAAVAMQTYVKRGLQARVHDAVKYTPKGEDVGGEVLKFSGNQYEPYYASSTMEQKTNKTVTNEEVKARGEIIKTGVVERSTVLDKGEDKILAPRKD